MGIVQTLPEVEKKPPERSSPLAMDVGTYLKELEGMPPATASAMLSAKEHEDRKRALAEARMEPLRRMREAEVIAEQEKDTDPFKPPLSLQEWGRLQYPELTKLKKISRQEHEMLLKGYATYLATQQAKQRMALAHERSVRERALNQARIQEMQRFGNLREWMAEEARSGRMSPAEATARWREAYSHAPRLESRERIAVGDRAARERIAAAVRASKEGMAEDTLAAKVQRWRADRALRERVAAMRGQPSLVPDSKVRSLIVSGKNIGKKVKDEELTFENWMYNEYLPVAQSLTPQQRARIRELLGDKLPSEDELIGKLKKIPGGTPARWLGLIDAKPPGSQAFDRLDYILEAMRLCGATDERIQRLRVMYEGKLRNVEVNGG